MTGITVPKTLKIVSQLFPRGGDTIALTLQRQGHCVQNSQSLNSQPHVQTWGITSRHFSILNLLDHLPAWSPEYGHTEMAVPSTLVPPNVGGNLLSGKAASHPPHAVIPKWQI